MPTVMDVVLANPDGSNVLVERHESYLMGPLFARCVDENEAYARNYSETEPSVMFLLDKAGIERSWEQGRKFAEAGVPIIEIIGSRQGRGPDTGLRISEGYQMTSGHWVPFRCHPAVDYPGYNYAPVLRCLREIGNPFVAQWMNGLHPDLVRSDTPRTFRGRVAGFVESMLDLKGLRIITSHFEIVTLIHMLYVESCELGTMRDDWEPTKGGGVLICKDANGFARAWDYNPDLTILNFD